MKQIDKERVIAYIDGYNMYFGMKDSGFKRYLWLNYQALIQKLLRPNQQLVKVNYFTTLVTNDVNSRLRQKEYVKALETLDLVKIHFGKFQNEKAHCTNCGNDYVGACEKMTDVGIATEIMIDYYEDNFDAAMIISGDTDLLPPIRFVNNSKHKRAFVAFPPNRVNDEVRYAAKGSFIIGRKNLADSQFDDTVVDKNGDKILKPSRWE